MNQCQSMKATPIQRFATMLALMFGCANGAIALSTPEDVVGEVTTLIGVSSVKSESGQEQALQRGALIRAGDHIQTAAGGHVHIRFIDGGLVSVRPMSRLHIESYRNAGNWGPASIKFTLESGVMRSVTGQWGEAAKDRFRLNTPVAAIGVKGTDFIVKASNDSTYATVISGAIVMASLEGDCAKSLGPCSGNKSATLSADMQGKMLEIIQQSGTAPRLVPAVDLQAKVERPAITTDNRLAEKTPSPLTGVETVSANEKKSNTLLNRYISENVVASENKISLPVIEEVVTSVKSKPMVWLHNALGWNVPENSISQRFDTATADGRQAVAGNFFITLYRDDSTPFMPIGTQANFKLTEASASYAQSNGAPAQAVQISNASLKVDFTKSTFNTNMNLASPALGQETFAANGTVSSAGLLSSNLQNQTLYGAISKDGTQAGYGFDKTTAGGKVSGITLWGR